ncbi:MAG: MarR family transcriptional regulator [Actinobacteria bacterium]|nr:MarR family transcriptional regulator [Actinomycetota bacterium]
MDKTDSLVRQITRTIPKIIASEQSPLIIGEAAEVFTLTQTLVLITLADKGELAMAELASHLKVSAPTMTGVVDRLEKRAIVARKSSLEDRRKVSVALGQKGEEVVAQVVSAIKGRWQAIVSTLTDDEKEQLAAILKKIEGAL